MDVLSFRITLKVKQPQTVVTVEYAMNHSKNFQVTHELPSIQNGDRGKVFHDPIGSNEGFISKSGKTQRKSCCSKIFIDFPEAPTLVRIQHAVLLIILKLVNLFLLKFQLTTKLSSCNSYSLRNLRSNFKPSCKCSKQQYKKFSAKCRLLHPLNILPFIYSQ